MNEASEYVAPLLPPTAAPPEPARRIGFFKAFLLFWLLPKRYGPHLAAGSWARALAAHLVAVSVIGVVIVLPKLYTAIGQRMILPQSQVTPVNVREALADTILLTAVQSSGLAWSWLPLAGLAGLFVSPLLVVLLVGTTLMPWAAGGDRATSVWKRSVRNVLWSATFSVPATAISWILSRVDWAKLYPFDIALILVVILSIALGAVLFVRMLICGAGRYVGPPDGPAFAPREPRCDDCGYPIVHLPLDTRCPECGLAVSDSLPGGRRQPTDWHRYELHPQGLLALLRLQWTVLRDRDFFRRLPVQSGMATARHFWWGTYMLMTLTVLFLYFVLSAVWGDSSGHRFDVPSFSEAASVAAIASPVGIFGLQVAGMFVGCLWSQWRLGVRDYRVSATACYYAAPLLWPFVLFGPLVVIVVSGPLLSVFDPRRKFELWDFPLTGDMLGGIGLFVVFLGCLVFWRMRLGAALRAVRYANV